MAKRVKCKVCQKLVGAQGMWRHMRAHNEIEENQHAMGIGLDTKIPHCERCAQKQDVINRISKDLDNALRAINVINAAVRGL